MYAFRTAPHISLPAGIQQAIENLRRTAMVFKPVFRSPKPRIHGTDNWREASLIECVRKVREQEDPEYSQIFAIFNKLTRSNLDKLTGDIVEKMSTRDAEFRLRISTLLFDKAITNHVFASVMADCALRLSKTCPDIVQDLATQVAMFHTLYNMNDTIVCSDATLVEWTKQKERRRGYAKFMTELNARSLITDDCVHTSLEDVLAELLILLRQTKTEQNDENIQQCAVFLFETLKLIPASNKTSRVFLSKALKTILDSKPPTLGKKSQFKLEDALKLVSQSVI